MNMRMADGGWRSRFGFWLTLASLLWAFLHAPVRSQEFVAETTVRHQAILHSDNQEPGGYAVLWTSVGFGRTELDNDDLPRVWQTGRPYVLFRLGEAGRGPMRDFWLTEQETWDAHQNNLTELTAASWNFLHFRATQEFEIPEPIEPITWEDVTENLSVGYLAETELILVKLVSNGWEWTVRGAQAVSGWATASDKDAAKAAAEAEVR